MEINLKRLFTFAYFFATASEGNARESHSLRETPSRIHWNTKQGHKMQCHEERGHMKRKRKRNETVTVTRPGNEGNFSINLIWLFHQPITTVTAEQQQTVMNLFDLLV